jgi:RNA polymerase sigma-70 factor, ECF subfamily
MIHIAEAAITPPQPTDRLPVLVAEAQRNPAAFAALYDSFVRSVYRYVYRRVGNSADAEDLTAQIFLAAFESLPRYRENGYFAAWLFTIARSKVMDHFRTSRPQVPLDSVEPVGLEADVLHHVVRRDELAQLSRLIRALSEEEQELIRLRYVADLPFAEMAAVLKKNEAAVKKSLYRLLARLQSQMEAHHD